MNKTTCVLMSLLLPSAAALAAGTGASKDQDFAMKAAQGGMAEVAEGKLAAEKAADPKVKSFGQKMADDHAGANDELKTAAAQSGITLPSEESKRQKAAQDKLSRLSGDAFDREYARMEVKEHEDTIALFKKEAQSGQDPNLKAFAQKTLPHLEEHLRLARDLPHGKASSSTQQ